MSQERNIQADVSLIQGGQDRQDSVGFMSLKGFVEGAL